LITGALASTCDLFLQVDDEKTWKKTGYAWPIATIGCNTCPMAASSGFYQSLEPPPLGNVRGIVPAHRRGHQNGQQSWPIFSLLFCLLLPWQPLGQYGASSCPTAASVGFQSSPGHAALDDALCIAPTYLQGFWNGQQRRNILMPSLILYSTITVAK
jgi:hypothetical protein